MPKRTTKAQLPVRALLEREIARRLEKNQSGEVLYVGLNPADDSMGWLPGLNRPVTVFFFDAWQYESARSRAPAECNIRLHCDTDLPDEKYDTVVVSISYQGEAELTRDVLQQAHQRLKQEGWLWAIVDNPSDRWLADQLQLLFGAAKREVIEQCVFYQAQKKSELRRVRDFWCEFPFRDAERLLWAYSRPGVFAHRRVDAGARRLLEAMHVHPDMRILEIGCGSGVVSLAAAARQPSATVYAIDSHTRAVQCLVRAAHRNALSNVVAKVYSHNDYQTFGRFDLIITNPPYYSRFEIARRFLEGASAALNPGGMLLLVTKHASWYQENILQWFAYAKIEPVRSGYWIVRASHDEVLDGTNS
jgi:16S rRNA (guanine1207-N2)-methyltransferase